MKPGRPGRGVEHRHRTSTPQWPQANSAGPIAPTAPAIPSSPVPDEIVRELLKVAPGSGSLRNRPPRHFTVLSDPEQRQGISTVREVISRLADAPLAIVIVLDGRNGVSEVHKDGRFPECLLGAVPWDRRRDRTVWCRISGAGDPRRADGPLGRRARLPGARDRAGRFSRSVHRVPNSPFRRWRRQPPARPRRRPGCRSAGRERHPGPRLPSRP